MSSNEDFASLLIDLLAKTDTNREILISIVAAGDLGKVDELSLKYAERDIANRLRYLDAFGDSPDLAGDIFHFPYDPTREEELIAFMHQVLDRLDVPRDTVEFRRPGDIDSGFGTYDAADPNQLDELLNEAGQIYDGLHQLTMPSDVYKEMSDGERSMLRTFALHPDDPDTLSDL